MRIFRDNAGFSMLELLAVIVILNILAAVSITVYVGVREKARRSGMTEIAVSSKSELRHWLQSSLSPNHKIREIDTNFSGSIDNTDSENEVLLNNVAAIFAAGRNTIIGEKSPWFNIPLWNSSDPPVPGTISLTQPTPGSLKVVATGKNGEIITQYDISAN